MRRLWKILDTYDRWFESKRFRTGFVIGAVLLLSGLFLFRREPKAPPPPPSVTLTITSEPPGAHIFVANSDTGKITPASIEVEAELTYVFTLLKEGFEPDDFVYDPAKGNTSFHSKLKAAPPDKE